MRSIDPYAEERELDIRTFEEQYKAGKFTIPVQVGLAYLSPDLGVRLNSLIPPEWVFE